LNLPRQPLGPVDVWYFTAAVNTPNKTFEPGRNCEDAAGAPPRGRRSKRTTAAAIRSSCAWVNPYN
jgi:hypothetical protein